MKDGYVTSGCAILIVLCCLNAVLGAFLWPYTLNTWLIFFGKSAQVVWWQGSLLGFVPWLGNTTVPAAIITWLVMLFLM